MYLQEKSETSHYALELWSNVFNFNGGNDFRSSLIANGAKKSMVIKMFDGDRHSNSFMFD